MPVQLFLKKNLFFIGGAGVPVIIAGAKGFASEPVGCE
jgi:hypothetical protein